ncbi:NTP transferase domain-containing protein [Candidatus Micrarchaeota archaeon]|nr:NTP transferase domain-containing protein [Candidatus Micrarchaeota archaeon]
MKAVVLAAGKGVRLRPLTDKIPKVMVKVKGVPLLEHVLMRLVDAGIEGFEIIVGYKKEAIVEYFGKVFAGLPINYIEQDELLGTAHAIALAEGGVSGNFLVVNGDVLVESTLFRKMMEDENDPLEESGFDALVVGREVIDPWRYGVLVYEGEILKDIVEKPEYGTQTGNVINAGIYRFNGKIFPAIRETQESERAEFEIVDSIKLLMKSGGKAGVLLYEGTCLDIGDAEDLKSANEGAEL